MHERRCARCGPVTKSTILRRRRVHPIQDLILDPIVDLLLDLILDLILDFEERPPLPPASTRCSSETVILRRMADTSIPDNALSSILDAVDKPNAAVARQFPGDAPRRQPVHVGHAGAHLF